jgi:aryl-alcohol dehydrogenase-like predicted oxidoreductase
MESLLLGKTGLQVSRIALGTAAFGLPDYGIPAPGESGALSENDAVRLIHAAIDHGINFFDTARGYGESEAILGKAVAGCQNCVVATKVGLPADRDLPNSSDISDAIRDSLATSLRCLSRETLDIVQIHNATVQDFESEVLDVLDRAREQGKIRFIGASVYGEEAALAAIRSGRVEVLQIAVNLLDQRMLTSVLPEAKKANVGVIARSALLKGALTDRAKLLPSSLRPLTDAAARACEMFDETWESLPRAALRFCLSVPGVHSVLAGLKSLAELPEALAAEADGPFSDVMMKKARLLKLEDEDLLNPAHWPQIQESPVKVEL